MLTSLLDNDLYKFTMQQAVLELYPDVHVEYRFTNRRPEDKFSAEFFERLQHEIHQMQHLALSHEEETFLRSACPFFKPQYLGYLNSFRYDPNQVSLSLNDGQLELFIAGPWHETILWEVPLMSLISEICFQVDRKNWTYEGQEQQAIEKATLLSEGQCQWADFGSRRRRSYHSQELIVQTHKAFAPWFVGSSNVHFAHRYGVKPIGTMAHEWIMAISVLEGLRHANRHALRAWHRVYQGSLGVALTDTFGSDAFFADFDAVLTRQFDGVRHDSGDPFAFIEKTLKHYERLQVPASTKTIVFSDSLDTETAIQLQKSCQPKLDTEAPPRIRASFGIGTHLTNDFGESKALNMVIKLWSVNDFPVVKLSDTPGKAQGEIDAVRVARWTFDREPLDEQGYN